VIIGCGDIGARTGRLLIDRGWRVTGVRRNTDALPRGFEGIAADYSQPGGLEPLADVNADYCLFTPLPLSRDPAGYESGFRDPMTGISALPALSTVRHFFYVSSTRVYAEKSGGAVDEQSALTADDASAMAIAEGERVALARFPSTVIRPSGLYGAGPGMLLERVASGVGSADPARISNRIHRDDLAGLITHLLLKIDAGEVVPDIVNATDDCPVAIGEVEAWLAQALGVSLTAGASSPRQAGSRRILNRRLHDIGYQLQYPDWRAGYAPILAAWRDTQG
jgi:nucleoside-diphosphate-sugar epimerase